MYLICESDLLCRYTFYNQPCENENSYSVLLIIDPLAKISTQIKYIFHRLGLKIFIKIIYPRGDSNPQSPVQETDALSIRPRGLRYSMSTFFTICQWVYYEIALLCGRCRSNILTISATSAINARRQKETIAFKQRTHSNVLQLGRQNYLFLTLASLSSLLLKANSKQKLMSYIQFFYINQIQHNKASAMQHLQKTIAA